MQIIKFELKEAYPFLGENGRNPYITAYLPHNMAEMGRENCKRPCIVVCPGGGYDVCTERESEPIALHFATDGYNAFVLNYSVRTHSFPVQLTEVAAALDLIHKKSEEWNCDTEKIAIIGFSAGGHLAAHYSTAFDSPEVRRSFPESYPVNATVLSYPVITALPEFCNADSILRVSGEKEITESVVNKFSCERLVSEKTPPTFLWHTAEDACVPVENSLLYAAALSKNKVPFEMHIYPYGEHGLCTVDDVTNNQINENVKCAAQWLPDVKRWLKMILA